MKIVIWNFDLPIHHRQHSIPPIARGISRLSRKHVLTPATSSMVLQCDNSVLLKVSDPPSITHKDHNFVDRSVARINDDVCMDRDLHALYCCIVIAEGMSGILLCWTE